MCDSCIKGFNNRGGIKKAKAFKTYGQVKSRAHMYKRSGMTAFLDDTQSNLAVEAHLTKIINASKQRKFKDRKNAL